MRRALLTSSCALALAMLPASAFAQDPQQQPQPQPQQQEPAPPAQPAAPKLTFKSQAGMLLVQIKPDGTAAFEEMVTKLKAQLAASTDPTLKQQADFKVFKSMEASAGNSLYVVLFDPAVSGAEYSFLDVYFKTLTPEQQRDPATTETLKTWAAAFASMNILHLTPVAGGGM
jgi:hypothetical protein